MFCSHRGCKLISRRLSFKKQSLRCPYHSWSYDFTGKLVATPHIGGVNIHDHNDFRKDENSGLKEVRSRIWLDLIIVNISDDAIPFDEYIKPLEKRWSTFIAKEDYNLIHHPKDFGYFSFEAKCNWKFAIENFCESYHLLHFCSSKS